MDATPDDAPQHLVLYVGPDEGAEAAQQVLGDRVELVHVEADEAAVSAALRSAVGFLDASTRIPVGRDALAAAERLRIVSCASTGSAHIDQAAAADHGIAVRTLREDPEVLRDLTPAAELTWTLVLACARRLTAAVTHVQAGGWQRELFPGVMLRGRRMGLVGAGRIGQWVARYATAFGMDVVAHDPYVDPWPDGLRRASLEEAVTTSDVISVHVHLSEETRGLVGSDLLERCRPGTIVINTSRGGIVDEVALLDGLRSGRIAAAGLDVVAAEPDLEDDPLIEYARAHDNLLITPHIGGFSPDAVRIVCRRAAEKVRDALGADTL